EKSGGHKGAGVTGEKDDKLYQSGLLLKADSDDKYTVVLKKTDKDDVVTYKKLDDAKEFMGSAGVVVDELDVETDKDKKISIGSGTYKVSKKCDDLSEAYNITYEATTDGCKYEYILVNTSGKIIDSKSKNKDGNDYYFMVEKGGKITGIYVED
ncbi:MAG: argininosuccinate lyase, partial [Lachnospiraceae bacterium]